MADLVFVLVAACVMLALVLVDNRRRSERRNRRIELIILDVNAGAIKYKADMISRLKQL